MEAAATGSTPKRLLAMGAMLEGMRVGSAAAIVVRLFKKIWLTLADMSDATIRMARQQEPGTSSE